MKFSKSCKLMLAGALLIGGGIGFSSMLGEKTVEVEAAAPTDGITYRLVGTVKETGTQTQVGWDLAAAPYATWVDDEDGSEFSWATGYHEFTFDAVSGDTFKFVVDGPGWTPWWMTYSQMYMNTSYFADDGTSNGNVLVKETGTYTLRFTHEYQSSDKDNKPNNIHITGTVAEVFHTVTVMNGAEVVETVQVADGQTYTPSQIFVEDHVLEGYYADSSFTEPYDGTLPITEDTVIYAHYVECQGEDYWVYFHTFADNPIDHVYYWSSATGFDVPWDGEGVQIAEAVALSPVPAEGKAYYRIKIKVEYQADRILFHNGEGEDWNQTIDLVLPSESCVFDVGAPTADGSKIEAVLYSDSDVYAEALAFLDYWSTIRIDDDVYEGITYQNSICYLLTDIEAWSELNGLYTGLTPEAKALVDPVDDGEATVLETMEYLANAHAEPAVGPAASIFFSEPENVAGITAGALVLVSILGFSVFYFVRRRKHASN